MRAKKIAVSYVDSFDDLNLFIIDLSTGEVLAHFPAEDEWPNEEVAGEWAKQNPNYTYLEEAGHVLGEHIWDAIIPVARESAQRQGILPVHNS